MSTLQQIRQGVNQAWDMMLEGWRHLYHRASNAITRFTLHRSQGDTGGGDLEEMRLRSSGWGVLAAEVFDDRDRVVVRLEAPGLEPGEFHLEVVDDMLVVRGEKRIQRERSEGRYRISECAYGSFERAIALPDAVDSDRAEAKYSRGILRVELPKSKPSTRRRIEVQVH
jgi:HSP20 family protein